MAVNLISSALVTTRSRPYSAYLGYDSLTVSEPTSLTLLCSNTYVSVSGYGYAFAGSLPCDSALFSSIVANPSSKIFNLS